MGIFNEVIQEILNNPQNVHNDEKGSYSYITKGVKQYYPEPSQINPAEEEAKQFSLRLDQIKSEAHNVLNNEKININKKDILIKQATKDIKLLFIEMMDLIFNKDEKNDYLTIEYHVEYERVIIKGHFHKVFLDFMNSFDIKLDSSSCEFHHVSMKTLSLNNATNQEEFMNSFEQYYHKYNDVPLQPKKSTKKLKK